MWETPGGDESPPTSLTRSVLCASDCLKELLLDGSLGASSAVLLWIGEPLHLQEKPPGLLVSLDGGVASPLTARLHRRDGGNTVEHVVGWPRVADDMGRKPKSNGSQVLPGVSAKRLKLGQ